MKKVISFAAVTILCLTFLSMTKPVTISAAKGVKEQCLIIAFHGNRPSINATPAADEEPVNIQPQYSRAPQGACVVWVNWAQRSGLRVVFKDGKAFASVTQAPVGFRFTPDKGYYLTDYLSQGETATLRFMKAGTYRYELQVPNRVAPVATGSVTVFKP